MAGKLGETLRAARDTARTIRDVASRPTDIKLVERLILGGIEWYVVVPCSITAGVHQLWDEKDKSGDIHLITTTNEHNLPAIAAGINAGTKNIPLIHMQNSGLPNAGDGIISLAEVYQIPMVVLATWRGSRGEPDSPPHHKIGKKTDRLTRDIVGKEEGKIYGTPMGRGILHAIDSAMETARTGKIGLIRLSPDAFKKTEKLHLPPEALVFDPREHEQQMERYREIVRQKGTFTPENPFPHNRRLTREEAMEEIRRAYPDAAILWANGYNARAAQGYVDGENNFYNAGNMGGTLAMGWGVAKSNPNIRVVVVDGDQNSAMSPFKDHLASNYPPNLEYVVFNNKTGVSVGTALSVPLAPWIYELAHVISTIPEEPGTFRYDRVQDRGEEIDTAEAKALAIASGTLPAHYYRWRNWIEQQTRRNIAAHGKQF